MTKHILTALGSRFGRYDYTDASKNLPEESRERLDHLHDKMRRQVLSTESDPAFQDSDVEQYDVLVVARPLHASENPKTILGNAHRLLKSEGKLILPTASEYDLFRDVSVLERGFRLDIMSPGPGSCVCDDDDIDILIATATENQLKERLGRGVDAILVTTHISARQTSIAEVIRDLLHQNETLSCSILSISDHLAILSQPTSTPIIFLAELDQPCLSTLEERSFNFLQRCLSRAQTVVWVSSSPTAAPSSAEAKMIRGLARVLYTRSRT
jgi:hypothetical protein